MRRMAGGHGPGPAERDELRQDAREGAGRGRTPAWASRTWPAWTRRWTSCAEIVEFLKTPEKFRRLGGRIPKGVLLVGPPGTGKTLLARAVAGEAGVPFFSLSGSEFVEMFVGVGAARVRDLFAQANAKAPCIIFIDELDAIGKSRNAGIAGGHDEREQTLNQLLAEMDGFDAPRRADHPGGHQPAGDPRQRADAPGPLRPAGAGGPAGQAGPRGDPGDPLARREAGAGRGPARRIAARTPGFAGADLANVVNEAALLAARRNQDAVMRADFEEAIERVVAGLEKKNRRMNEREKEIVAYHEAGHAVVGWMLPHAGAGAQGLHHPARPGGAGLHHVTCRSRTATSCRWTSCATRWPG